GPLPRGDQTMSRKLLLNTRTGGPAIVNLADTIAPPNTLVFIDSGIANLDALVAGVDAGATIVMLDASGDPLGQIAEAMEGRGPIDAIHIIANGREGEIAFSAGGIGLANLASHGDELAAIGAAMRAD